MGYYHKQKNKKWKEACFMKRFLLFTLVFLMLFSVSACTPDGENASSASDKAPLDIEAEANSVISAYSLSGGTLYSSASEENKLDDDLIRSYYGDLGSAPDFGSVEAYAVYIDETKPLDPCEFGFFKLKDGADAEQFILYLKNRINTKIENAKAYPTMDTSALTSAEFGNQNGYVWYCAVKGANGKINGTMKEKV